MYALVLVLNKTEYLEDILNKLLEIGVKGATILDSQGMGSAMVSGNFEHTGMLSAFKSAFDRQHPYNKTVFTVIEDEALLHEAMDCIKNIAGDLSQPGEGLMFTVPVMHIMGMAKD